MCGRAGSASGGRGTGGVVVVISDVAASLRGRGWSFFMGRRGWVAKHAALLVPGLYGAELAEVVRLACDRQRLWDRAVRERSIGQGRTDTADRD